MQRNQITFLNIFFISLLSSAENPVSPKMYSDSLSDSLHYQVFTSLRDTFLIFGFWTSQFTDHPSTPISVEWLIKFYPFHPFFLLRQNTSQLNINYKIVNLTFKHSIDLIMLPINPDSSQSLKLILIFKLNQRLFILETGTVC